jgi:hypothetical protein
VLLENLARWPRGSVHRPRPPRPGDPRPAPRRWPRSRRRTASRCRSTTRGDLARQRVHVVAEQRAVVGVGVEVEVAPGGPSSCFTAFMIWWRSWMNGLSPGQTFCTISWPGSCRANGWRSAAARPSARDSGAITRLALKSSEARAR